LAHEWSPNWQDQSTQTECDAFDAELGDREKLAEVTGSGAHHVSFVGLLDGERERETDRDASDSPACKS
jgi:sugar (pentulose or hexulose) kinase